MKTCLNCGRQLTNEGYYGCCSMSCSKAWELKKVNTAANIAQAGLLAEQNKMLEQQIRQQKAAEAAEHAKNRAEALQKMYEVGFKSEEEFNSFLKDHPEALSMTMEESGKYKEEIKAKERKQAIAQAKAREMIATQKREFKEKVHSKMSDEDRIIQNELGKIDHKYSKDISFKEALFPVLITIIGIILRKKYKIFPSLNFFTNALLFLAIGQTLVFINAHRRISTFVKELKTVKRKSDFPEFIISKDCFSMQSSLYACDTFAFKLALGVFITISISLVLKTFVSKTMSIVWWIVVVIVLAGTVFIKLLLDEDFIDMSICKFFIKKNLFSELGPFVEDNLSPHGLVQRYEEYIAEHKMEQLKKYIPTIDENKHNELLKKIGIVEKQLNEDTWERETPFYDLINQFEPDNSTQKDLEKGINLYFNSHNRCKIWIFNTRLNVKYGLDHKEIAKFNSVTEQCIEKTLKIAEKYDASNSNKREEILTSIKRSLDYGFEKYQSIFIRTQNKHL